MGVLFVISSRAKPPSDEARAKIQRDCEAFESHIRASAHVLFGEGFVASAKRSVLSLLLATSRPSFPLKVFADVTPALVWQFKSMGEAAPRAVTAKDFAAAIGELCRARLETT